MRPWTFETDTSWLLDPQGQHSQDLKSREGVGDRAGVSRMQGQSRVSMVYCVSKIVRRLVSQATGPGANTVNCGSAAMHFKILCELPRMKKGKEVEEGHVC